MAHISAESFLLTFVAADSHLLFVTPLHREVLFHIPSRREGKEKYRTRGAERQTVKDRKEGGRKVVGRAKYRERDKLIKSGVLG